MRKEASGSNQYSETGCMANKTDDQRLVDRVKEGDRNAFDVLVLKYQHKIVKLVMRYIRDPARGAGCFPGSIYQGLSSIAKISWR